MLPPRLWLSRVSSPQRHAHPLLSVVEAPTQPLLSRSPTWPPFPLQAWPRILSAAALPPLYQEQVLLLFWQSLLVLHAQQQPWQLPHALLCRVPPTHGVSRPLASISQSPRLTFGAPQQLFAPVPSEAWPSPLLASLTPVLGPSFFLRAPAGFSLGPSQLIFELTLVGGQLLP